MQAVSPRIWRVPPETGRTTGRRASRPASIQIPGPVNVTFHGKSSQKPFLFREGWAMIGWV